MPTHPVQITDMVRSLPDQPRFRLTRCGTALLVLASLLTLSGAHALETTEVNLAGEQFQVDLAVSHEEKRRGLMHRDRLAADSGMLFIYTTARPTRFWNKNVRFPIDILYFDTNQAFLHADTHVPPCPELPCPVYHSGQPVKYVLELPAGSRERLGLRPGQRFTFHQAGIPAAGSP